MPSKKKPGPKKRAGKKPYYTEAQMARAIRAARGLLYIAAKKLGCTYPTVANYIKKSKYLQEVQHEAREAMDDTAESNIFKGVDRGNTALLIFYAKTRLKHRGYQERTEVGGNIKIEVEFKEQERAGGSGQTLSQP